MPKISELQAVVTPTDTDQFVVNQGGVSKMMTRAQIRVGLATSTGALAVKDEGSAIVSEAARLNFVGAGVTVTDAGAGEATVTIAGASTPAIAVEDDGASIVAAATTINFAGAGVIVTDAGSGEATVTIAGDSAFLEPTNDSSTEIAIGASTNGTKRRLTSDSAKTATLLADAPVDTIVELENAGLNLVTIECQPTQVAGAGAGYYTRGQDQSGTSPATTSFTVAGSITVRCVANSDNDSAVFVIEDAQGISLPETVVNSLTFSAGVTVPNGTAVSGTLTAAEHGGGVYPTSGNCTITPAAGFCVTLKLGGAHTVGAGGAAHAGASGDIVSVICWSATAVDLCTTLAASVVNLPTS